MTVTLRRWKYNNTDHKITNNSRIELQNVSGACAAECMEKIYTFRNSNDLSTCSPWEIIFIKD